MNNYLKIIIFYPIFLLSSIAIARSSIGITDIESTRTQALAGAGVGSILLNEAPLLNPAAVVFFNKSSFYAQNASAELSDKSKDRTNEFSNSLERIVTIIDNTSRMKGGVSYQYQKGDFGKRIRYSASMGTPVGPKSAIGLIYRYTKETSNVVNTENYHQYVLGFSHIASENLTLGMVIVDPTQNKAEYFKYTLGFQYKLNDFINLLLDSGSGDVQNYSRDSFNRLAIQLRSFKRFYIRYGKFHDLMQNYRGTGFGFSWVGPRFSLDFAQKISEVISQNSGTIYKNEKIQESSFALAMIF